MGRARDSCFEACARPTGGRYVRTTDDPAQQEQFLHACDLQLGRGEWPEPPEVYRKICEAKDPAAVLERFKPEDPQRAFVNLAELYDTDLLVHERRLVPLTHAPVEDLSE